MKCELYLIQKPLLIGIRARPQAVEYVFHELEPRMDGLAHACRYSVSSGI